MPHRTLWIMWGSFVVTHALIAALPTIGQLTPSSSNATLALLLPAVALGTGSASLLARLWLRTPQPQTFWIVRWALAESATLLGFVGWYAAGSDTTRLACTAIGVLAHLMAFPRAGAP